MRVELNMTLVMFTFRCWQRPVTLEQVWSGWVNDQ